MNALPATTCGFIENRTFDEIEVGDHASLVRTLSQRDIELFAAMSGDVNPAHMDPAYARTDMFHRVIAHGMWGGALVSTVLGTELPGPGTIYLSQDLHFQAPIGVGDTVTITVTAMEKIATRQHIIFDCRGHNQNGEDVLLGSAEVKAPSEKIHRARIELPEIRLGTHDRFHELMARAASGSAISTAVVHPCDEVSLRAALEAANAGLIIPILVGPSARIHAAAKKAQLDIDALRLVDTPHSHAAAATAVALVRSGEARLLMKGALHTDELMHAVVAADSGLRTDRRLSHVYLFDVPGYARPLLVTDAAINIAPSLADKRDIIQNAIDLAHIMGLTKPRVAVLSAVETVNPAIPSTVDAAALCKMAERGQISGGLVDGPLAFDNAISPEAAREKNIVSPVAGLADILVVPDLESGNMLAKQLTFLAGADAAGIVMGARVPIILTSRADSSRTHVASCAVAVLVARSRQAHPLPVPLEA